MSSSMEWESTERDAAYTHASLERHRPSSTARNLEPAASFRQFLEIFLLNTPLVCGPFEHLSSVEARDRGAPDGP